jgi:hypothetical protein
LTPALINERLFYVAVSRARESAEIYTDNRNQLKEGLARDVSKTSALSGHQIDKGGHVPNQRERAESDSSFTIEAVVRNYAERLAQVSEAFAAATRVSEYGQVQHGENQGTQPDRQNGNEPAIKPQGERNAHPEMEISL